MKHLKVFEQFDVVNCKSYFMDKINWKLVNFIQDNTTEYYDSGNTVCIYVMFHNNSVLSICDGSVDTDRNGTHWGEGISLNHDQQGVLNYIVDIYSNETSERRKDLLDELNSKIMKKFNWTGLDHSMGKIYKLRFVYQ